MRTPVLFFLAGLVMLATSCGQDAASKKLAADTEAQVVASIRQVLIQTSSRDTSSLGSVRTWYQSEVPNIIKLDPGAEAVYRDHAAILSEAAINEQQLSSNPILTAAQAQGIRSGYQKLADESSSNVAQLTKLASSKTTMSEAEQRKFVTDLAGKENHQLQLTRYFTKRTAGTIDLKTRQQKSREYNLKVWGHE